MHFSPFNNEGTRDNWYKFSLKSILYPERAIVRKLSLSNAMQKLLLHPPPADILKVWRGFGARISIFPSSILSSMGYSNKFFTADYFVSQGPERGSDAFTSKARAILPLIQKTRNKEAEDTNTTKKKYNISAPTPGHDFKFNIVYYFS